MARRRKIPVPRPHTGSDGRVRCRIRIDGHDHYCGLWGTPEADAEADRLIAAWLNAHRGQVLPRVEPSKLTVAELVERFDHDVIQAKHCPGGKADTQAYHYRSALAGLLEIAGTLPASSFTVDDFEALRREFVARGWARSYVQAQSWRVRQLFAWATHSRRGLIAPTVAAALDDAEALPAGVEDRPVREPPADALVERTLALLAPVVASMVRVQRHSGMRPGEICRLRHDELDASGELWLYEPRKHKTRRHSVRRRIWLGPRAKEALAPWVAAAEHAGRDWLFPTTRGRCRPFSTAGYCWAVKVACLTLHSETCAACVRGPDELQDGWMKRCLPCAGFAAMRWSPLLLRSARLTEVAEESGILGAQATGSHKSPNMTMVYVREMDRRAQEAARKSG